jgi:hypothetical protein
MTNGFTPNRRWVKDMLRVAPNKNLLYFSHFFKGSADSTRILQLYAMLEIYEPDLDGNVRKPRRTYLFKLGNHHQPINVPTVGAQVFLMERKNERKKENTFIRLHIEIKI